MLPPQPHAVVFDLGKVLLDFDFRRAALALAPKSRIGAERIHSLINQTPLLHRFETGLISDGEFYAEFAKAAGYEGTIEEFAPAFADIFWEIPEVIELNRRFRATGLPTYLFSNTSSMVVDHIRVRYPFFMEFNGHVLSYEERCMKPATPIYEAVERAAGVSGPGLVYFDDRAENVEAALARGWSGHVFTGFGAASGWLAARGWLPDGGAGNNSVSCV